MEGATECGHGFDPEKERSDQVVLPATICCSLAHHRCLSPSIGNMISKLSLAGAIPFDARLTCSTLLVAQ
jgi:hypothetical protein